MAQKPGAQISELQRHGAHREASAHMDSTLAAGRLHPEKQRTDLRGGHEDLKFAVCHADSAVSGGKTDSELNDLMSFSPNPLMTSAQFFKTMEACRCTAGNCFALKIERTGSTVPQLNLLDPTRVFPIIEKESGELWWRIQPDEGAEMYVHDYYMIHVPFISTNGIAGMLNMTGGTLIIEGCHNYGEIRREVSVTTKGANTDVSVGGILAYARPLAGSKVKDCVNHAAVWTNTNNGSTVIRIGGIVGYSYQNLSVVSCINEGAVTYENHDESVVGSTVHIGGIVAHPMRNSSIDACKNTGNISANRRQVNRAGGIVGTLNNSSLSNCENTGSVSVIVPEELGNWQSVGGIVGFGEGSGSTEKSLENNINRGSVTVKVNTNQARMAVGGIIGMPYTAFTMKGNKNYGAVSGQNSHTTSPYCYVGGIFGLDSSAGNASSISDNSNYGAISIESGNPSFSAAGGLFGDFGKASAASGSNFGSVTASVAGAVAGKNASSITVTICDAVTVNGVTKAAASDEGAWLCPSNTGTIIPTYVAHSNSE